MNSVIYVGMDIQTTNYTLCCFSQDKDKGFAIAQVESNYINILEYRNALKRISENPAGFSAATKPDVSGICCVTN